MAALGTGAEVDQVSAGVIPVRLVRGQVRILLIQQTNRLWCFPKGRLECGETARQAAERELREETGLLVQAWLGEACFTDAWRFRSAGATVTKTVTLFPALVRGFVARQVEEVLAWRWCGVDEARSLLTFPSLLPAIDIAVEGVRVSGLAPCATGAGAGAGAGTSAEDRSKSARTPRVIAEPWVPLTWTRQ